jgi:ZIP family zinc transporter
VSFLHGLHAESPLGTALLLATVAGLTIPIGAFLATIERIRPRWLQDEFRHSVLAFGGGALFAAVALVLVPEGIRNLEWFSVCVSFGGGGVCFFLIDRAIARRGGAGSMLMAMLLDFVPEAMAVGVGLATRLDVGLLLALLIALQNLPESFNAYREIVSQTGTSQRTLLTWFSALVVLGPLSAYFGHVVLASYPAVSSGVMLFAAGGIIYLTFEDIAPQTVLKRHWAPPLGAVAGFLLGLLAHVLIK